MRLIHNEEYDALIAARDELADLKAMLNAEDEEGCVCCGLVGVHKMDCPLRYGADEENDEQDFLAGKTCNAAAPEECESCQ